MIIILLNQVFVVYYLIKYIILFCTYSLKLYPESQWAMMMKVNLFNQVPIPYHLVPFPYSVRQWASMITKSPSVFSLLFLSQWASMIKKLSMNLFLYLLIFRQKEVSQWARMLPGGGLVSFTIISALIKLSGTSAFSFRFKATSTDYVVICQSFRYSSEIPENLVSESYRIRPHVVRYNS